ncbi:MAG TPA: hypothetical protein VJU16_05355 [Planctomycetota bacterium]|nr:hypothetical protein [Planctomycetota bacterium]
MCRIGVVAAIVAAAFAPGCAGVDERHAEQMMLAQQYYSNGKFYEAIGRFAAAAEHASSTRERYQATLGVANATAEYGLIVYEVAERYLRDNKRQAGMKKWQEADKWHEDSAKAFYKCLQMRPDDKIANRGLGDLFYRRSTSFSVLPYLEDEKGFTLRKQERDEAVRQYHIVLDDERGDITRPDHGPECKSPHIHRYLALALFTRSDWDKQDGQEARRHMIVYLNFLKWALKTVGEGIQGIDEEVKLEKEKRMEHLRRQIAETRSLLNVQLKGLQEIHAFWQSEPALRVTIQARLREIEKLLSQGSPTENPERLKAEREKLLSDEKKFPPKEKRETWILAAHKEIAALNELAKEFEDAAAASRKKKGEEQPERAN